MKSMNDKLKECFTPHVLMHSLFGLGLGVLITALIPMTSNVLLGISIMGVAIFLDMMRK